MKTQTANNSKIQYRFLVVEYCFDDDSHFGKKNILGSYSDLGEARKAAGEYIKRNVSKMKKKYRCWQVDVIRERIFFDIRGF